MLPAALAHATPAIVDAQTRASVGSRVHEKPVFFGAVGF